MQSNGSFRLIVRRGPQPNQIYELNKDIITLGRDITNDIVINDPEVSRHHCRLTRGGGGYTLEDLGSTNGTFVNGQRLTGARPLAGGDVVGLAPQYAPPPPPPPQYQYQEPAPAGGGLGRWFFLGCGCLIVLCIVLAVVAVLVIDSQNLWCRLPILRDVVRVIASCPAPTP